MDPQIDTDTIYTPTLLVSFIAQAALKGQLKALMETIKRLQEIHSRIDVPGSDQNFQAFMMLYGMDNLAAVAEVMVHAEIPTCFCHAGHEPNCELQEAINHHLATTR